MIDLEAERAASLRRQGLLAPEPKPEPPEPVAPKPKPKPQRPWWRSRKCANPACNNPIPGPHWIYCAPACRGSGVWDANGHLAS